MSKHISSDYPHERLELVLICVSPLVAMVATVCVMVMLP